MPAPHVGSIQEWLDFWRDTTFAFNNASITNAVQQIFPANPRRIALFYGGLTANRVTLGFGFAPADSQGLAIQTSTVPNSITIFDVGQLITLEINAILNAVGPQRFPFWEVISNRV